VLDALAPAYAHGIFAHAASWPVVMRLSTTPGDVLDDKISTPRGLALKAIGVEGARVDASEGDIIQDFVMVNGPAFLAPSGRVAGRIAPVCGGSATAGRAPAGAERGTEQAGRRRHEIQSLARGRGAPPDRLHHAPAQGRACDAGPLSHATHRRGERRTQGHARLSARLITGAD
jgi:hypothetical protein